MSTQDDPVPAGASQDRPGQAAVPVYHVIRRTRAGGLWVALAVSVVVLVLLLVFILENGKRVDLGFFGAHATLPLGVALLLAAAAGALIVVIPGTGRIMQLRIIARRHRRRDARTVHKQPPELPGSIDAGRPRSRRDPDDAGERRAMLHARERIVCRS